MVPDPPIPPVFPDDGVPVIEGPAPALLVDHPSGTGEGPLWNVDEQCLYWVDIPRGELFRYDPATGENTLVYTHDGMIGGYTFQEDGSLLLFGDRGQIVRLAGGEARVVIDELPDERESRFNDVIADPLGRVLCGTMPAAGRLARLYLLNLDGSLQLLHDDIGLSNGFGFSPDNRTVYHTDSNARIIFRLTLDPGTGAYSDRQPLITIPDDGSVPDGMATDAEGTLWSARWDGHALYRITPDGDMTGKVPFPVRKVSSVAFGGPDLATAFVTSAGGENRGEEEGTLAGSLFSVDLGVRGRAPFRSRITVR